MERSSQYRQALGSVAGLIAPIWGAPLQLSVEEAPHEDVVKAEEAWGPLPEGMRRTGDTW